MAKKDQVPQIHKLIVLIILVMIVTIGSLLDIDLLPTNNSSSVSGKAKVHFIDVGQGDSIFIQTPSENILIDAGERGQGDTVVNYLEEEGVHSLDMIIGTHPHSDHIGGLIRVLEEIEVKEVVDPGVVHTSKTYEDYLTLIDENNITFTKGQAGMKKTLDSGATLEICSPSPDHPELYEDNLNEASIVTKFTFGNVSFLLTGDAEVPTENMILESGFNVNSTILKAGHHGSTTSNNKEFIKAVSPEAVIIMCGLDNSYGHPHDEILKLFNDYNIPIYRTDINGSIVISTDGESYDIVTEK